MKLKQLLSLTLMILNLVTFAQPQSQPADNLKQYQENYKWRIEQSTLAGQYIPKDLPDAISELNKLTEESSRDKFKALTESEAEHKLYFSLGRWVATNWGFYEGSRLSHYIKEVGITFPEDQAIALIIAWHRTLNKKEINFKEIRDRLVEKRKKEHEERLKNKQTIIKEEIKKAPNAAEKIKN
jgi:hypothetical protein